MGKISQKPCPPLVPALLSGLSFDLKEIQLGFFYSKKTDLGTLLTVLTEMRATRARSPGASSDAACQRTLWNELLGQQVSVGT